MKKRCAIIAENSLITAMMTKLELEKMGIEVIGTVNRYVDFIEMYAQNHPNLILMDIHLEGMYNGINAIQRISNSDDLDVIFLLTYFNNQVQEKLKQIPEYQYLKKPFDDVEIQSLLAQYLTVEKGSEKGFEANMVE